MTDATLADVSSYYDVLHLWARLNKGFRSFSGQDAHAIHRWLVDSDTGEFSPDTIHKIILSSGIANGAPPVALDAGCGYGGTMFALHAALGGQWHGLTISRRQLAVAHKAARRLGVEKAVTFARGSFDDPQPQRYDLVCAIESFVHSADPARTAANLAQTLRPGGRFVIIDDMPVESVPKEYADDLASFKTFWRAPKLATATQWSSFLAAAGCEITETRDLSNLMRPRSEREVSQALVEVGARRRWRDRLGLHRIGDAEVGGLLLERLGREGIVRYCMITAVKRG